MRKHYTAALFGLLVGAVPAFAQVSPPSVALAESWYEHFLGREDLAGANQWGALLDQGQPPEKVLAGILGSPEYYARGGNTPDGFVQRLFLDLTDRPPTREQLESWTRRLLRTDVDYYDRVDLSYDLLLRYPQNYQVAPPPPVYDRDRDRRDWDRDRDRRYWDRDDDYDYRRPYYPPVRRDRDRPR